MCNASFLFFIFLRCGAFRCEENKKNSFGVPQKTYWIKRSTLFHLESKAELYLVEDERQHKDENTQWEYCIHEFTKAPRESASSLGVFLIESET